MMRCLQMVGEIDVGSIVEGKMVGRKGGFIRESTAADMQARRDVLFSGVCKWLLCVRSAKE